MSALLPVSFLFTLKVFPVLFYIGTEIQYQNSAYIHFDSCYMLI